MELNVYISICIEVKSFKINLRHRFFGIFNHLTNCIYINYHFYFWPFSFRLTLFTSNCVYYSCVISFSLFSQKKTTTKSEKKRKNWQRITIKTQNEKMENTSEWNPYPKTKNCPTRRPTQVRNSVKFNWFKERKPIHSKERNKRKFLKFVSFNAWTLIKNLRSVHWTLDT